MAPMDYAYPTDYLRDRERAAVAASAPDALMKRAAAAIVDGCRELLALHDRAPQGPVAALVGGGDNGGDALYALAGLAEQGVDTLAIVCTPHPHERALRAAAAAGVSQVVPDLASHPRKSSVEVARVCSTCEVIIDGLVGTGGDGPLRQPLASLVATIAKALRVDQRSASLSGRRRSPQHATESRRRRPLVLAVDLPSGIGTDNARVAGEHLVADLTLTMGALKPQVCAPPAVYSCGRVDTCDIGLDLDPSQAALVRVRAEDVGAAWPVPGPTDHKYTRGVASILAGSSAYPFTGVLCVQAAQRAGCGMVRYNGPDEAALAVLTRCPEAVSTPGRFQAALVGPGLSGDDSARVRDAAEVVRRCRAAHLPLVMDAGALSEWATMCESMPEGRPGPLTILTPHAGEAAALLTRLGCGQRSGGVTRADVDEEPLAWAGRLAEATGCVVLLKGQASIVAARGIVPHVVREAPGWAGTAGSGDVLAGIVVAAVAGAQARSEERGRELRVEDVARAGAHAAWVHAHAAALAAGTARGIESVGHPIVATDIADHVPYAIAAALSTDSKRYNG